jgi:hypothetical protein
LVPGDRNHARFVEALEYVASLAEKPERFLIVLLEHADPCESGLVDCDLSGIIYVLRHRYRLSIGFGCAVVATEVCKAVCLFDREFPARLHEITPG